MQEVQEALSRDLFGHQFTDLLNATQLMRKVGELSDVTAQEVAESRKAYQGAYDALAPFKRLLDVWVSEYLATKRLKLPQVCMLVRLLPTITANLTLKISRPSKPHWRLRRKNASFTGS